MRSDLLEGAAAAYVATPWWPHASLLHGAVYGVPLGTDPGAEVDNRPAPEAVRVALGSHDDDVIGALASAGFGPADDEARRDTERLLGAFTAQVLRELGSPNGAAAVEEHEHGIAFGSLPGGLPRRGPLPRRAARQAERTVGRAGPGRREHARSRDWRGAETEIRADQQVRLSRLFVDRRATDPQRRGAARSSSAQSGRGRTGRRTEPRRGGPARAALPLPARPDGRGAGRAAAACATATTAARRPTACSGAAGRTRRCASSRACSPATTCCPRWATARCPPRCCTLAQEAVLHSPYQRRWLGRRRGRRSRPGRPAQIATARRRGRHALRQADAVYDGSTRRSPATTAGVREGPTSPTSCSGTRCSSGAEPSPIGVTAWSQPWVPLWLEWEAELALAPTLRGWRWTPSTSSRRRRGAAPWRRARHTGRIAAHRRRRPHAGRRRAPDSSPPRTRWRRHRRRRRGREDVEDGAAALAGAVEQLDLLTATLDGMRQQLLGLDAAAMTDGCRAPAPPTATSSRRRPSAPPAAARRRHASG